MSSTQSHRHSHTTLALWLCAIIWGSTFLFQKTAMDYVTPLLFNTIRFALSVTTLSIFLVWQRIRSRDTTACFSHNEIRYGALLGTLLGTGITLQQIGISHTTTSNASFITGLYVILVPFFTRMVYGTPLHLWQLAMSFLAAVGLFFLSTADNSLSISTGDTWVLISAFVWSAHVGLMNHLAKKGRVLQMTLIQMMACLLISIVLTALTSTQIPSLSSIQPAMLSLLYAGVLSGGIAFLLQVYGQRSVAPGVAAIILSLESVFGALCGWYFLNDPFNGRNLFGAILMMTAIIAVQFTDEIESILRKIFKLQKS